MKKVSVRAFQLKPYDYLKELPIHLTRYGVIVALVEPIISGMQVTEIKEGRPIKTEDIKSEDIGFSPTKKKGYHFNAVVNGYVKD